MCHLKESNSMLNSINKIINKISQKENKIYGLLNLMRKRKILHLLLFIHEIKFEKLLVH